MFCIKCNAIIPAGCKMCNHCGQTYDSPAAAPEVVKTEIVTEPPAPPPPRPSFLERLLNGKKGEE